MLIVGGGTIGLSAAYHAARRGLKVTLIDRFPVPPTGGPNDFGSSRGLERMFRILYSQQERVRLVETAYAMWHELEQQVGGAPILAEQDLLFFGNPDISTFEGNIHDIAASMDQLGIPYDSLEDPAAIAKRYPIFRPEALRTPDGVPYVGLVQNNGATINVQRAFQVVRGLADRTGRVSTAVGLVTSIACELSGDWVVTTDDGARYHASYLVLCPGVWLGGLLAQFGLAPASKAGAAWSIWQMSLAYFPRAAGSSVHWPIWYEFGNTKTDADRLFYGFPDVGFTPDTTGRLKISADYTYSTFTDPAAATRVPDPRLIGDIQAHLRELLQPGVLDIDHPTLEQACLYSMSPDGDMVLGRIPVAPEVEQFWPNAALFCMASGRGFKYTPLFGRVLVDLATTGKTAYQADLSDFSTTRAGIFQRLSG
ncbi:Glycine/D-amino acid oxidase [Nannocystis exedens]|uniref:Glycine/D-amino acid oxidase n=2 Tax=Nannocystis exedens TaxID=54 RepID=A0A1I2GU38_9BACT|nr:FAD-dependent oxidoreductase [Nannocystis exedens]SFF20703.1 Glycine/D-amino acid oxidase [Nannocystis exedens]